MEKVTQSEDQVRSISGPPAMSAPLAMSVTENTAIMPMMTRVNLYKIVSAKRGRVLSNVGDCIPLNEDISVICVRGHICNTPVACIHEWCTICMMLDQLNKRGVAECAQSSYDYGQRRFEFKCGEGHRFMSDIRKCKDGCRSCAIIKSAQSYGSLITIYPNNVLLHDTTRIRCHCENAYHDPNCPNPECVSISKRQIVSNRDFAVGCKNLIRCNQDFYVTEKRMKFSKSMFSCQLNHWWEETANREILSTVRTFEILFDSVFDDVANRVEFTGYNRSLRVAFTHCKDTAPNKCIDAATLWCTENDVRFIRIPATTIDSTQIAKFVSAAVSKLEIFSDNPVYICNRIRDVTHKCGLAGKIFPRTLIERETTPHQPNMNGLVFVHNDA